MTNKNVLISLLSAGLLCACTSVASPPKPDNDAVQNQENQYSAQIEILRQNPSVKTAIQNIVATQKRAIDDMILLTEIPAPPFKEQKRAKKFADMLRELGLTNVTIDTVGNVIAKRAGTIGSQTVALVAHMDTVFPEGTDVHVKIDGNTYTAPGIGDNTRGMASLLAVVRAMQNANIKTNANILFIGSVGEEGLGDLRGVRNLFEKGRPKIDSFIAIDGGNTSRLIYGAVGSHRYRVTYRGPGGHSWGAYGAANPHYALGRAMDKMSKHAGSGYTTKPKVSVSVGRIGGGTSINSIAFESWMEIDMRSTNAAKLTAMDKTVQKAIQQALTEENANRVRGPALTVEIKNIGIRPAGVGDINGPLVQRSIAAMKSLGITSTLKMSSTDSNIPISLGIPAITMSRGGKGSNSHSPDEYWQDIDTHIAVQGLLLTLVAQAEQSK